MQEVLEVLMWINICVFLPLTILFICCLCCARRRYQVPVIYYTNLLIANLIQLCMMIFWERMLDYFVRRIIYSCGVTASVYFKMCIALERYFFITYPLFNCLRQTKGSVLVCVLVWALCTVSVVLATVLQETLRLIIYALLPAPLFIFCLAGTFKALPAATSVPTEEKRRILGTLILLLLNSLMINLPAIILLTVNSRPYYSYYPYYSDYPDTVGIIFILVLLSSLLDLILVVFKCKGPIDKLLAGLCCCSMENRSTAGVTDGSTERRVHVVRDEGKEKQEDHMMGEMRI